MESVHSVFVIGESRTNADNAITKMYGTFYMAFEVDDASEQVIDFSCTHTISTTETFLRKLFLGQRFSEIDGWLEDALVRPTAARPAAPCWWPTATRSSAGGR